MPVIRATLRRLRREQSGFTLTELLVACIVGTVVLLATFSMLDTSVKLTGKVTDRVDRTQRARLAMELITRKLRSQVCPSAGQAALIDAQDYSVRFYSFMGTGAFVPDILELKWDTNTNTIQENRWAGTGAAPNTTWATTPTTKTLLTDVKPTFSPSGQTTTRGPVFTYYLSNSATALTTPLSAADLKAASRTSVGFMTYPATGNTSSTTLQTDVFARTADPNGLTGTTAPECA
jgi:prepilin-type N-terminal cleavage/methylation domain-containing protein